MNRTETIAETFLSGRVALYAGDCLDVLATLPENSVDSVVCDPPYHLTSIVKRFGADNAAPAKSNGATGVYGRASAGFMGKRWDGGDIAFQPETWAAVLRVMKPGAHLLAFGGTRTFARMAVAIEDAGFEVRDTIMWLYGSGFPKSLDISKAIDRAAGAEREVVGRKADPRYLSPADAASGSPMGNISPRANGGINYGRAGFVTAPATDDAAAWSGFGTALKPACEPIVLARKPLSEKTVAANVLRWGTGALNVDGCRVATAEVVEADRVRHSMGYHGGNDSSRRHVGSGTSNLVGRWPANVITDGSDEVVGMFPDSEGSHDQVASQSHNGMFVPTGKYDGRGNNDSGSAARFFYTAAKDSLCGLCGLPLGRAKDTYGSCDATIAETSLPTESTLTGASAQGGVADSIPHERGTKRQQSSKIALNAVSRSQQCPPQKADIAHENVPHDLLSRTAQNVRSAASLCSLCATDIARALVAARQARSAASIQFQDFISGRNAQILIQHLALYVAGRESTDTILTTASLRTLLGSVFHAIDSTMRLITDEPRASSEKSRRFWYGSKADGEDRVGSRHPTVKPLDLIQYLVRLVTPPGGTVLDLFAGTGTTGEAAFREGFNAILIEREPEYCDDIRRRMALVLSGPDERARESIKARNKDKPIDPGPLFGAEVAY